MKVAILGAGLSGLSCAITLEGKGVRPVIYEKQSQVGDRFVNGESSFYILTRPYNNCLQYFAEYYNIHLKPTDYVKTLTVYSENSKADIHVDKGNIGYVNIRGRHPESFENQLRAQVKSEIRFNSNVTYFDLLKEYTHVVIATGDGIDAARLGNYRTDLTATYKGATAVGTFKTDHPYSWLDYSFAPQGYAYLIPFSEKEAHIVTGFPDYPVNKRKDINNLWESFFQRLCRDIGQDLRITDRFQIEGYAIGICNKGKIDNTYFIGNNFGCIMPSFGFGQFWSISTGVYAAYDICGTGDYESLTKPFRSSYKNSLVLRRILERSDNKKLDRIIRASDNHLVNMMFSDKTKFNYLRLLSYAIRPFVKMT